MQEVIFSLRSISSRASVLHCFLPVNCTGFIFSIFNPSKDLNLLKSLQSDVYDLFQVETHVEWKFPFSHDFH